MKEVKSIWPRPKLALFFISVTMRPLCCDGPSVIPAEAGIQCLGFRPTAGQLALFCVAGVPPASAEGIPSTALGTGLPSIVNYACQLARVKLALLFGPGRRG